MNEINGRTRITAQKFSNPIWKKSVELYIAQRTGLSEGLSEWMDRRADGQSVASWALSWSHYCNVKRNIYYEKLIAGNHDSLLQRDDPKIAAAFIKAASEEEGSAISGGKDA